MKAQAAIATRGRFVRSLLAVSLLALLAALPALAQQPAAVPSASSSPATQAATGSARALPKLLLLAGVTGGPAAPAVPKAGANAASSPGPSRAVRTAQGNALNGVQDFIDAGAYSFTVPQGVTSVLVQLYGAGGGGAGGNVHHAGGGGGGTGAYAMSVVAVTAGATYTINVGAAGTAGALNEPGGNGGDTSLVDPNGNVIVAAGGGGGEVTGEGGAGGQLVGNPMIGHPGRNAFEDKASPGYLLTGYLFSEDVLRTGSGGAGKQGKFGTATGGKNGYAFIAY
jgi:Glycine-rich domain